MECENHFHECEYVDSHSSDICLLPLSSYLVLFEIKNDSFYMNRYINPAFLMDLLTQLDNPET